MSKPRYPWWGYVKNMIRAYPDRKSEYEALHTQSMAIDMSGMPRGCGGASRSLENLAIRELPATKQREYEAVRRAVETIQRAPNGQSWYAIINLVYWRNSHTLDGAALEVGYSKDRAKQLHGEFIRMVAKNYGLMDSE